MEELVEDHVAIMPAGTFDRLKQRSVLLRTESLRFRKERLRALKRWINENRTHLHKAVYQDMRKPATEFDGIELLFVLNEIKKAINNLDRWSRPTPVDATLDMLGTRSVIRYEPRGVCLIISPWNYPFSLCVGPLVSALAAGNNVVLKPSEFTPHTSAELERMVKEVFDPEIVSLYQGGAKVSQELLKLPFDHIFFTGSPQIGKEVMKAAAEHLASVTLELGGKCPVVVTASSDLNDAAQRIAVCKFVNAGQTCVAPDYVLVERKVAEPFLKALTRYITSSFVEKETEFIQSEHYSRIITDRHFNRLQNMLQQAIQEGANLYYGGDNDPSSRFFHPTVLTSLSPQSQIMREEIFGPILPVVVFDQLDEAVRMINNMPKPLALYLFTSKTSERKKVLQSTSSGGVCINDCSIHFLHNNLPFGGVNNSGLGKSHGYHGFLDFSNQKPVLKQRRGFTSIKIFYPPYTTTTRKMMDWFLKLFHR